MVTIESLQAIAEDLARGKDRYLREHGWEPMNAFPDDRWRLTKVIEGVLLALELDEAIDVEVAIQCRADHDKADKAREATTPPAPPNCDCRTEPPVGVTFEACSTLFPVHLLDGIVVDPDICSGYPVIRGTRVTLSQILAEVAEGNGTTDIAEDMEIDLGAVSEFFNNLSRLVDHPFTEQKRTAQKEAIEGAISRATISTQPAPGCGVVTKRHDEDRVLLAQEWLRLTQELLTQDAEIKRLQEEVKRLKTSLSECEVKTKPIGT